MVTLIGARPSVSLYKLTVCFFVFNISTDSVNIYGSAISPRKSKAQKLTI